MVVLFLVLALPVAELYLHLRGKEIFSSIHKFTPGIGWRTNPGLVCSSEGRGTFELFWDDGTRASRYPRKKDSKYRVAVVGCSYTEGVGVRDEDTFVWKLNDRFPNTVFDNYGCSSYGARQCYLLVKELLQKKAYDLVIYCAISTHTDRFTKPIPCWINNFSDDQLSIMPWTEYSKTRNIYHPGFTFALPGARRFLSVELLNYAMLEGYCALFSPPSNDCKDEMFVRTILEMDALCADYDTDLAVVYLSGQYLLPALPDTMRWTITCYPQENIPGLPLRYRVDKQADHHPNRVVHNYWALAIGRWLRKQGFVTE